MTAHLATCTTQPINAPAGEFRLMPYGLFRAIDGRPQGIEGWRLTRTGAQSLIAQANARVSDYAIDYEHQTLNSASNGQPVPAAGWFKRLEWREGDGLYVVDARWTPRASAMIMGKEYRFISPTFRHDLQGNVLSIVNAALTNNPALDGLTELAAASCRFGADTCHQQISSAALAYQAEMAAKGRCITTVQAVAHVSPPAIGGGSSSQNPAGDKQAQALAQAALDYQTRMAGRGIFVTTTQAVHRIIPEFLKGERT